jgi:hypothetical protein
MTARAKNSKAQAGFSLRRKKFLNFRNFNFGSIIHFQTTGVQKIESL